MFEPYYNNSSVCTKCQFKGTLLIEGSINDIWYCPGEDRPTILFIKSNVAGDYESYPLISDFNKQIKAEIKQSHFLIVATTLREWFYADKHNG